MTEYVNGLEGYQAGNNYNRLKPILRKGNFNHGDPVNHGEDLTTVSVVKGQGVKSPATQLQEKLGYSKGTMQARFKEWASSRLLKCRNFDIKQFRSRR